MMGLPEGPGAATGYRHPAYAQSLAEFGTPRFLPRAGGWVLERALPHGAGRDAMGCYPFFSCTDWSGLKADMDDLAKDLVCLSLITDPFGRCSEDELRGCFGDKVLAFKQHFVADLHRPPADYVSKHHRYYVRRALDRLDVERCADPGQFLDEWSALYDGLVARHQLTGMKAFSRRAFALQLTLPGIVMLRARHAGETVGAHLWYRQGDVVHSHLAASSPLGYELMASYALYWSALETFAGEARWLNFGAGAGVDAEGMTGLAGFKKGWAGETRTAYFCGRIFDAARYDAALAASGLPDNGYFPAYRYGEFP
jgi:Acetyltransferase (GNAT) domain